MGQHWIRSFSWIPAYIHDRDLYVKDFFPEGYLRDPFRIGNILMTIDNQFIHDSVKGSHLDEIRKTYFGSDRIGLFFDTLVNVTI
jgi:hypothetical protein